MIEKISTKDMSREQWLEARKGSIGGSDAAAVLGLTKWNSAYALWCEKTGKVVPEDISDKEVIRLGNDLEQYVAERFSEETGKKVQRCNYILRNSEYPFAHANPDRLLVGEKAGLECKTSSSWEMAQQCRAGAIPQNYYAQCVHYLMVTGLERWYLSILVFGVGLFTFTVERDEAEISALAASERSFWDRVSKDIPPETDGSEATTEALRTIYADSRPGETADLSAVGHHIDAYNALTKQIAGLTEMQNAHANAIKDWMQTAEKGIYGTTTISWKSSTRRTFDKAAYEKANGRIDDRWYKESAVRSFRVTTKESM